MLDVSTVPEEDELSFTSLLLFGYRSGESFVKRVQAQPVQLCNVRLMW